MSEFLPEGQTQHAEGTPTPVDFDTEHSDVALMQRVLKAAAKSPNRIPSDFMAYIVDFLRIQ